MSREEEEEEEEPFPWHLGVYDAHCHPTDTMASMAQVDAMQTRVLTVMATRAEDQELVVAAAAKHGVPSSGSDGRPWERTECIVPCFGWHPWFAHQMYLDGEGDDGDDDDDDDEEKEKEKEKDNTAMPTTHKASQPLTGEAKIQHYQTVLQPTRCPPSEQDRQLFLALPDPTPFSSFLAQTRQRLQTHRYALVGEIGLDRAFRIPEPWSAHRELWQTRNTSLTLGGRERRPLTPFRCCPRHQRSIFQRQLRLAAAMGRGVSVHGVQAHGMLFEAMQELWARPGYVVSRKRARKKRSGGGCEGDATSTSTSTPTPTPTLYPPRICLHSYSGSPSTLKQYLRPDVPARVFASFSTAVNLADGLQRGIGGAASAAWEDLVRTVPDDRLLVESDLDRAGDEVDARLEEMVRRLCAIKGWGLQDGVMRLGRNWRAFVFGGDGE